jgi:2-hydroxychromene-2-carboxylate isomerase
MADPIEIWFEFSSPYGYLAAREIEALDARRPRPRRNTFHSR